jgi:hypothetical protein
MKKRVEIHVDRLVLHDVPAGQRGAVSEAVERELAKIGLQQGFAPGRTPQIPPVRLPKGDKPS